MEKITKTGEHSFRVSGSDTIVSNSMEETAPRVLTENNTEKEKVYYTATPRGFQAKRARAAASDAVSFDSAPRMQVDKQSDDSARYEATDRAGIWGVIRVRGRPSTSPTKTAAMCRSGGRMLY